MDYKKTIKSEVNKMFPLLVDVRRHLHRNPELSFKEKMTSAYIQSKLDEHGISYKAGYCKYGIVAETGKKKSKKMVYLRGDMDALPIKETNAHDYVSQNEGIMHACGHDVHTTCVLGAAIILKKMEDKLPGTVKIIFQPGEEKLPGGASIMIKEGAVKKSPGSVIYGQHVHPPLETGKVGFHAGEYMASADELYIEIEGKGGHAALPQDCVDTILAASAVVQALHNIVSRDTNPLIPSVLSIGKMNSVGGATNVIPDKVMLEGTMRTMDEDNRFKMHDAIRRVVKKTAESYGASSKVKIKIGYPSLYNNPDLVEESMMYAREFLGKNNVVDLPKRMTAEDFSYYSQMMPACFFRLGTRNEKKGITAPVHTSKFDIDEKALKTGVGLMAYLAVKKLAK